MLAAVRDEDRRRLLDAMRVITDVLTQSPRPRGYLLRAPRPGEAGWVVQRNAAVYAEEFGWDASSEALVARIVADYLDHRDPAAEAAWIAEVDGVPAGCVFCVRENATTARLRLLWPARTGPAACEGRCQGLGQCSRPGLARGQPPAASLARTRATSASFG